MANALKGWQAAAESIRWRQPWETLYEPGERGGHWFPGATLNAAENCVDRHLPALAEKVALHWEGEPGDRRAITYRDLHGDVSALADALSDLGVGAGDRVAIYMGLLPETVVTMLACARIGAVHALMAAALPADALADRLADFEPKVLVTQDGAWRHGVILPLKARADEAIPAAAGVDHTIVVRRIGIDVALYEGDRWYDELLAEQLSRSQTPAATEAPDFPADHPLLTVYIADRRGQPTGIVHGTGGFLTYAAAFHVGGFSLDPEDVLWCATEIAWITSQSHAIYGALACGGTTVIYEGMLDTPTHGRTWDVIERYGVTTFATTVSVLRNLRQWTDSPPREGQLDSIRQVVTAGEPSDPELQAWLRAQLPDGARRRRVLQRWPAGGIAAGRPRRRRCRRALGRGRRRGRARHAKPLAGHIHRHADREPRCRCPLGALSGRLCDRRPGDPRAGRLLCLPGPDRPGRNRLRTAGLAHRGARCPARASVRHRCGDRRTDRCSCRAGACRLRRPRPVGQW